MFVVYLCSEKEVIKRRLHELAGTGESKDGMDLDLPPAQRAALEAAEAKKDRAFLAPEDEPSVAAADPVLDSADEDSGHEYSQTEHRKQLPTFAAAVAKAQAADEGKFIYVTLRQ